ncbi:Qat anti-phage system TatD family nuclease QatD [Hyphomicrobium sp. DY-1]|uniref:Qat anti-phage system TatD family nuclease QatD n=1 Tax=Hyphomicrobium sp. DY-1 TaxID=3075650 RepID=UPI0039C0DF13
MIDFHCHLDLYEDPENVAKQAEDARIYVLSVTTTPKAWRGTAALGAKRRYIRTALGLHPQLAHERVQELALFEKLLPETRYVGEIGLDGSREFRQHIDVQRAVFDRILQASKAAGGKILTIHSRGAVDSVLSALHSHQSAATSVLHWFSGTAAELAAASRLGCWFSVGPAMLRSEKGRVLAKMMPRDRILTETDGPFAKKGNRPLVPADVALAAQELAAIWKTSTDEVEMILKRNLKELLNRVPGEGVAATK